MFHFVNAKENIVQEAIDGILSASGGRLSRLDGYPFIRVVMRADWDKSKVAIISGGGSGHEPAHVGFVGEGMLTATVCGDIFASPSVDAILAAILAVTGKAGCLLIVKSYTGDRLNFGLAAERARTFGLSVEMVFVEDDISLPEPQAARGIAGTLIVHKIAGEVSEAGGTLENVVVAATRAATNVMTIGMSLDTCSVPGSEKEQRIAPGKIELGLGIHGEPGVGQVTFESARRAMSYAVDAFKPRMQSETYVALLNNLGGSTALEMSVLARELLVSSIGSRLSHIIGPSAMMTALDMKGFSITLYPLNIDDELLLSEPSPLNSWPGMRTLGEPSVMPMPHGLTPLKFTPSSNPSVEGLIKRCCDTLIAAESELNALDAKTGDGDTGSTLAVAARALLSNLENMPLGDSAQLFLALAQELNQSMGGSSGVLLAIFFSGAGDSASKGHDFKVALREGLIKMKKVSGANVGDCTMVDALEPALNALKTSLSDAATAARKGADQTKNITKANAGRASYVSADQLIGNTDPGAEAVARVFEVLVE